jgi:D-alanyl-lipoteichoic acid acyltransferase DltB (MBOAT superfamily)
MLFNSASFIFLYLPIVLTGAFLLARHRPQWAIGWLALASFGFYAVWDWRFLPLLLASILGNYLIGLRILAARDRTSPRAIKVWLTAGVAGNLILLGVFKYAGFFAATGATLLGNPKPDLGIVLPLGISFFTFTQIAFLVDAARGGVHSRRADSYALFVSYFPHLIAGPILHHGEMIPQFERKGAFRFDWENIAVGLTIFLIGLFKKVVLADSMAPLANPVFAAAAEGSAVSTEAAWLAALAYTLQLYFDFSGYSDMAIGASRLIGVQLPLNFNSPYKAASAIEFWRCWHMTLSRFLRDYLYFPLGGNRRGPRRRYLNLMLVMLLGGLWHGAGWTFLLWGGLHGLYLVVNHLWRTAIGAERMPRLLAQALTFIAVVFAWVMFRAADLDTALKLWAAMLGDGAADGNATGAAAWAGVALLLGIAWFWPNTQQFMVLFNPALDSDGIKIPAWTWYPKPAAVITVAAIAAPALYFILFTDRVSDFLYFQF